MKRQITAIATQRSSECGEKKSAGIQVLANRDPQEIPNRGFPAILFFPQTYAMRCFQLTHIDSKSNSV